MKIVINGCRECPFKKYQRKGAFCKLQKMDIPDKIVYGQQNLYPKWCELQKQSVLIELKTTNYP
jgi:hypothetical protein